MRLKILTDYEHRLIEKVLRTDYVKGKVTLNERKAVWMLKKRARERLNYLRYEIEQLRKFLKVIGK